MLAVSLCKGRLAGAGLDVLEGEAVDAAEPIPHTRLPLDTPGFVGTPHIAG